MVDLTPEQRDYLVSHTLAVLGTGRRDGSPQLSMIMYHFDGTDLAISVTSDRAKWKNAVRQPKVSLLIPEGRRQMIIYGTAEAVAEDPGRLELTKRIRESMGRALDVDDETLAQQLDEAKRVILRVTPERVFSND